jgi:photosystem II stability/assembly factor-like uncharacterized protein
MLGGDRERRALMVFGVALVVLVAATALYMKPRLPALFETPPPPLSRVCDVSFVDGRHGSLVLCAAADATHESVFTTADAGVTWRRVRIGDVSEARVVWFDGSHAVLEGYVTRGIAVWASDDGGRSWAARLSPPPPGQPYAESLPEFADARHGVQVWYVDSAAFPGARGPHPLELWQTDDGARSWQRLDAAGISGDGFKHLLLFTPPATSFIAVGSADENTWPQLLTTADGRSWQPVSVPPPPYAPTRLAGQGMLRVGSHIVLWLQDLDTPPDRVRVYTSISSDGGRTWGALTPGPYSSGNSPRVDDRGALLLLDESRLWTSTDEGQSWNVRPVVPPSGGRPLQMVPAIQGALFMVAGDSDPTALLRSTDRGAHWLPIKLPA